MWRERESHALKQRLEVGDVALPVVGLRYTGMQPRACPCFWVCVTGAVVGHKARGNADVNGGVAGRGNVYGAGVVRDLTITGADVHADAGLHALMGATKGSVSIDITWLYMQRSPTDKPTTLCIVIDLSRIQAFEGQRAGECRRLATGEFDDEQLVGV